MPELVDIATRVIERARDGEQIEVFAARATSTSVRAYRGEVEAFTSAQTMGAGIRVVADGRQGFAYAGTFDDDVIAATLDDARDNARYAEYDEFVALAVPDGVIAVEHELWMPELVSFPATSKIDLAVQLEQRVAAADPRIAGVRSASFADSAAEAAVVSSTGISSFGRATFCSLAVTALARDGDATTMGGGHDLARRPAELDLDHAAGDAVTRAVRMLGARKPASQRLPIVLEPRLAATLLGIVGGMLCGDTVVKRRSPFADRIGEPIAAPSLTLVDDPTDARSFAADSHDGEGLACRPTLLIEDGVLRAFLHNTYTARRMATLSTASAVRGVRSTPSVGAMALQMRPGTQSQDDLIAGIDLGLFVQSLTGLHSGVNPVSGDFSVGVEGLMIRHGELAEPVREATLGSTLQRLLTGIVAVGCDLEWVPGGSGAATLVIGDVTLSGD